MPVWQSWQVALVGEWPFYILSLAARLESSYLAVHSLEVSVRFFVGMAYEVSALGAPERVGRAVRLLGGPERSGSA